MGPIFTATGEICTTCSRMNIETLSLPDGILHTSKELASKTCLLCKVLFANTPQGKPIGCIRVKLSQLPRRLSGFATWCLMTDMGTGNWRYGSLVVTQEGQYRHLPLIDLFAQASAGDPAAIHYGIPKLRSITSSWSQETISIAKDWFGHCLKSHSCHKSLFVASQSGNRSREFADGIGVRSTFYPTRLLDLQSFDDECLDIRLIESPASGSQFATLSHCWGMSGDTKCQTTTRTLRDLKERILYTNLPKTFRDAISVCRSLEIPYLWIDSLCIIQDSKEDWAREAASMSYVYSNSHLNISADWSPNSDGGCFKTINSPPGFVSEETVSITNTLTNGQQSCLYFLHPGSGGYNDLDSTPLASRAWVFQERFLSRRNLHFTQNQLFWECREGFAGEDKMPRCSGPLIPGQLLQMRSRKTSEQRLQGWCHNIVRKYSAAKITFPTDRLPAISALARLFSDDLSSPYLAGLWFEGLWYTLSWFRIELDSVEKQKDYIAPSWSWCSINAGVEFLIHLPSKSATKMVEILDAVVEPIDDPFGQVSRGWIRARGQISENLSPSTARQRTKKFHIYPDYPGEAPPPNIYWLLLGRDFSSPTLYYFLLLVVNAKDPNMYERWGMSIKYSEIASEHWPERTVTII
jgi:hypothetical protein